jgi:regulator of nucleoside diphosphate kinase
VKTVFLKGWDMIRLKRTLDLYRSEHRKDWEHAAALEKELAQSQVVLTDLIPVDVVTLNSRVRVTDLNFQQQRVYTLVLPQDADCQQDRISVFAPFGIAILGNRAGDVVEWEAPAGRRRLRLEEVLHESHARRDCV